MYKTYYKKIDRSMMDWGFTIPQEYVPDFLAGAPLKPGKSRDMHLDWNKKSYLIKLSHVNRTGGKPIHQLRWDSSKEFLKTFRRTFIQSYIILKSKKELFDSSKKTRKYFRTHLQGGQQEVITFQPINSNTIRAKIFIKIESEWNTLFQRLADENVFGWIFEKSDKKYLIQRSTDWLKVSDFKKHENALNVIYYLANTKRELLYIGKAAKLGTRVKPGRPHQNMPGDWDLFKYDIVKPEFVSILDKLEDHTIRAFASVLENTKGYSRLKIGTYKLVNSNWRKL